MGLPSSSLLFKLGMLARSPKNTFSTKGSRDDKVYLTLNCLTHATAIECTELLIDSEFLLTEAANNWPVSELFSN